MKDEFANRQAMHRTVVQVLETNRSAWEDLKPTQFTALAASLATKVTALETLIGEQTALITGGAERKEREENELEAIAHETGQALASYFEAQGREDKAAQVDLSLTRWQRMRHEQLLSTARQLHLSLTAELAANAADLVPYGLDAADALLLKKETDGFAAVIALPSGSIAERKALTAALRPSFREVSALLVEMDRLSLKLRSTEAGRHFVEVYKAARIVRDLGSGPANAPSPATPPP